MILALQIAAIVGSVVAMYLAITAMIMACRAERDLVRAMADLEAHSTRPNTSASPSHDQP